MVVAKKQLPELVHVIHEVLGPQDYLVMVMLRKFKKTEAYTKNKSFRLTVDALREALTNDTKITSKRKTNERS